MKNILFIQLTLGALFICVIISGCTKPAMKESLPPPTADRLTQFFLTCESDIKKAVNIVIREDIVKNLTHLLRMDSGGRKYYLLEREALSDMIRAVTEGTYTDLFLINSGGAVVYTMSNDNIFGKNVNSSLIGSSLYNCFINTASGSLYVEDMSIFPSVTGGISLFISTFSRRDHASKCVFVMQIDAGIIEKILDPGSIVIDRNGNYRISGEREKFLTESPLFEKINFEELNMNCTLSLNHENITYNYFPFRFKNLSWIILKPRSY